MPVSGQERELAELRFRGLPRICWIAAADQPGGRLVIQVVEFLAEISPDESLDFGVDETFVEKLNRHDHLRGTVDDVLNRLEDRLLLGAGEMRRAIILPATDRDPLSAFRILGDGIQLEIRQRSQRYICHRLVRQAPSGLEGRILRAKMRFCDVTAAGAVREAIRTQLDAAVRNKDSYLGIWTTYRQIESDTLNRQAIDLGIISYHRCEPVRDMDLDGWRFFLHRDEDVSERIREALEDESTELEASDREPNLAATDTSTHDNTSRSKSSFTGRIRHFLEGSATLVITASREDGARSADSPPEKGFLFLCQQGDRKRLQRQRDAEERIRTGRCPMPWLGLLLEGRPAPRPAYQGIEGMSPAVRQAFGGVPTPAQQNALSIALNTPDIALIQGPPGTGKTKVITALQCRVAELAKANESVAHRILVCSAQHEAVENVVLRSKVFGLTPFKVGRARNDRKDGIDTVELFRQDLIDRLQARMGPMPEPERADRARRAVVTALRTTCTRKTLADHIQQVLDAVADLLTPSTVDRLRARASSLRAGQRPATSDDHEEQQLKLEAAQSIRVLPQSFRDDGPLRARVALRRLDGILTPEERRLLGVFAEHDGTPSLAQFADIASTRDRLVDQLTPPPPVEILGCNEETERLLLDVIDELQQRRTAARGTAAVVVADWLHDLEYDAEAARTVLSHYTAVLASTLQHAGSRMMADIRERSTGPHFFDSVIVDEAARAHPLDLLIPMSQASRRIVLVGDHRQLPHMLEPDIERQLAERARAGDSGHKETEQRMRQSMFEHLWTQLKQLEAVDGIRRTATLDVQFRMHPVLGDFVSRTFYEAEGDRRIESPRAAADFVHQLSGYQSVAGPAVAAWLDVPIDEGPELRGRSKSRPAEAQRIAKAVRDLVDEDPSLSVGVIAFYRQQVEAIYEAMEPLGLTQRQDDQWQVVGEYRKAQNRRDQPIELLRIGTVDAFQGREFDIVFLSMTRSNRLPRSTQLADLRRKYGHLMLPNRMCVAMSRQHRLLVGVGDLAFAEAAEPLPHLRAFVELCRGPHGVLR